MAKTLKPFSKRNRFQTLVFEKGGPTGTGSVIVYDEGKVERVEGFCNSSQQAEKQ